MNDKRTSEQIAQVVHEAIRAYQAALGQASAAPWDEAQEWERSATFAAIEFRTRNPNALPSDQHKQWVQQKLAAGWTYGPIKDAAKKVHPSLVPYDQLLETERRKDMLVAAVVRALTDPVV